MPNNSSNTAISGGFAGAFPDGVTVQVANALTAAGTTITGALPLAKQINRLTLVAMGTGVVLPTAVVGMTVTLYNDGGDDVLVYAANLETIDGTAGATGVTLTDTKRALFTCVASGVWVSAQLGVISA